MSTRAARDEREDYWRGAELLLALVETEGLPRRYGAWAQGAGALAFDFDDLAKAAQWPASNAAALPLFLRCVGAAGAGAAWRSIVDGERLRRLAEGVSEPLLNAVLAIDPLMMPPPCDCAQNIRDDCDLVDLGRRLLLSSLPGSVRKADAEDVAQARFAVDAGRMLFEQMRLAHA